MTSILLNRSSCHKSITFSTKENPSCGVIKIRIGCIVVLNHASCHFNRRTILNKNRCAVLCAIFDFIICDLSTGNNKLCMFPAAFYNTCAVIRNLCIRHSRISCNFQNAMVFNNTAVIVATRQNQITIKHNFCSRFNFK